MSIRKIMIVLIAALGLSTVTVAQDYQNNVLAVQGYDVVSYHTGKRPVRGNGHFTADHDGATYLFSSSENQRRFTQNPARYVPAYGGYCAFGASVGKKFTGDPEVWRVVDGTLYLNLDANIQDDWLKDTRGYIKKADASWKKIKNKSPASL